MSMYFSVSGPVDEHVSFVSISRDSGVPSSPMACMPTMTFTNEARNWPPGANFDVMKAKNRDRIRKV